jgi:predicted anti-sigma-YlaC factor YlaD
MMIRCEEIKGILIFFVEGSLNHERAMLVKEHLEVCLECQYSFQKIATILSVIENEKMKDSNPYFSMKVMERIKNKSSSNEIFKAFHFFRIMKPALAIALIGVAIYTGILLGGNYSKKYETTVMGDSRGTQLQAIADEFYLNDIGIENIETLLIIENN